MIILKNKPAETYARAPALCDPRGTVLGGECSHKDLTVAADWPPTLRSQGDSEEAPARWEIGLPHLHQTDET